MKRLVLLIGLITSTLLTFAQSGVEVKIEPIEMMIGEQAQVTVTVQANKDDKVEFSTYQPRQQIVAGVEVIAAQHPSDNILQLTLTSFDGNLYYLPPFKVKVNGKTVESKSLALKVVEVEVDTTKLDKFFGPKDVQDNPFQWSDWSLLLIISIFVYVTISPSWFASRL